MNLMVGYLSPEYKEVTEFGNKVKRLGGE